MNEKSTLAVSEDVRMRVKKAAEDSGLSMYEYANRALLHCIENVAVRIEVEDKTNKELL